MGENHTRRRLLKGIGGCAAIGISTGMVSAARSKGRRKTQTKEQLRDRLEQNYNKKAAKIGSQFILSELRKFEKGVYNSKKEFHKKVTARLSQNPHTEIIAKDVKETRKDIEEAASKPASLPDPSEIQTGISTQDIPRDPAGDYLLLARETEVNASGVSLATITPLENQLDVEENMEAESGLYGTASAEVIRTTTFSPDESGTWDFVWDYDTSGGVRGSANTLIQVILDNKKEEVLKSLEGDSNQTGTETVGFSVDKGETYTLGLKYFLSADAFISSGMARFIDGGYISSAALTLRRP